MPKFKTCEYCTYNRKLKHTWRVMNTRDFSHWCALNGTDKAKWHNNSGMNCKLYVQGDFGCNQWEYRHEG